MTTEREVLRMALEALEAVGHEYVCQATHHKKKDQHGMFDDCPNAERHKKAITAIRAVLASTGEVLMSQSDGAQPERPTVPAVAQGEPVAWRWTESSGKHWFDWCTDWTHHERAKEMGFPVEYAYTTPQPAVHGELEELTAQRDKLADILTRTANALKGEPPELARHSWHDLPEVAQHLKAAQQQSAEHGEPASASVEPHCYMDEYGNVRGSYEYWMECEGGWFPLYTSPTASPSQGDIKPWAGLTQEQRASIAEANNMLVDDDLFDAIEAKLREKNELREKNA